MSVARMIIIGTTSPQKQSIIENLSGTIGSRSKIITLLSCLHSHGPRHRAHHFPSPFVMYQGQSREDAPNDLVGLSTMLLPTVNSTHLRPFSTKQILSNHVQVRSTYSCAKRFVLLLCSFFTHSAFVGSTTFSKQFLLVLLAYPLHSNFLCKSRVTS